MLSLIGCEGLGHIHKVGGSFRFASNDNFMGYSYDVLVARC